MVRKLLSKYVLLLGLVIVPVGGVYFVFQSVNQLSSTLNSMSEDFVAQQNSEIKQNLGQLVSLVEINQRELEQDIRALLMDGELGDLISNSTYEHDYAFRLESWLKTIAEKLDLEQVVVFSDRGVILAGYSEKPFLGASGLVDGGNLAFSYRTLIESAFISKGISFSDQFPDTGYNKRSLAVAFLQPVRDSEQNTIAGFGATRKINPDVLFSNYRRIMGEYAPKPFLNTDVTATTEDQVNAHPIINHHGEKIALLGIEKTVTVPSSIQTTMVLAAHINKFCLHSFYFLLIFASIVLGLFLFDLIALLKKRESPREEFPTFQDARTILQKSRERALNDFYYFA